MSDRGLVSNDHIGDGSCSILIGILQNSIDGSVEIDGTWSNGMENTSGTVLSPHDQNMPKLLDNCPSPCKEV